MPRKKKPKTFLQLMASDEANLDEIYDAAVREVCLLAFTIDGCDKTWSFRLSAASRVLGGWANIKKRAPELIGTGYRLSPRLLLRGRPRGDMAILPEHMGRSRPRSRVPGDHSACRARMSGQE